MLKSVPIVSTPCQDSCYAVFKWDNQGLFCLFSFFSNTNFTEKTVGFSRIRTQIVGVEGGHADHLTTTTARFLLCCYVHWNRWTENTTSPSPTSSSKLAMSSTTSRWTSAATSVTMITGFFLLKCQANIWSLVVNNSYLPTHLNGISMSRVKGNSINLVYCCSHVNSWIMQVIPRPLN